MVICRNWCMIGVRNSNDLAEVLTNNHRKDTRQGFGLRSIALAIQALVSFIVG